MDNQTNKKITIIQLQTNLQTALKLQIIHPGDTVNHILAELQDELELCR